MVNEDILTSLKNAISRGESLESAMATAINSGYNQKDVEEASQFISRGIISNYREKNGESLVMPSKKSWFLKKPLISKKEPLQNPIPDIPKITPPDYTSPKYSSVQVPVQKKTISPALSVNKIVPEKQIIQEVQIQKPAEQFGQFQSVTSSNTTSFSKQDLPKKQSYIKEILLLIILLLLIGALILVIKFKEQIVNFFS
ncbi:MAG: hypothetical protein QXW97_03650 [Candidatus Pacearchaeota archaeon]